MVEEFAIGGPNLLMQQINIIFRNKTKKILGSRN